MLQLFLVHWLWKERPAKVHSISLQVNLNRTSELFVVHAFNVPRLLVQWDSTTSFQINGFSNPESPLPRLRFAPWSPYRGLFFAAIWEKRGPIFVPSRWMKSVNGSILLDSLKFCKYLGWQTKFRIKGFAILFLFLSSQSEFFCRLIYCTSTQCTSSSGTMSSHGNADSRAHLLPAKFLWLIAKLRFVAHRSIVFTVSRILRAPWQVERLSGSNFFSHIEGAKCNSTQSSLQTSPRLKS